MVIRNRRELTEYLENVMCRSYEELKEIGKLEYEQNLLKTYMIEANLKTIKELEKIPQKGFEITIQETQDKYIYILKVHKGDEKGVFFVDTINPRFWLFHSINSSVLTDFFIKKLVGITLNYLDHPWFPTQFMEEIGREGIFRGFSLKYENEFDGEGDDIAVNSLSMRLWGTTAPKILKILRQDDALNFSIALSGIGIKYFIGRGDFVIDDISFWAKFTARGTSIDGHFNIISKIQRKYERLVKLIESNRLIYFQNGEGYAIEGQPITIVLKKTIEQLDKFLSELFSSKKPFRLWGIKHFLEKDFVRVNAIDLHTGGKLYFEITPDWIRVYLPKDSCGNTILRLFTNIQHYYDSQAKLYGGEDERII